MAIEFVPEAQSSSIFLLEPAANMAPPNESWHLSASDVFFVKTFSEKLKAPIRIEACH
jgi:hypothetical protein